MSNPFPARRPLSAAASFPEDLRRAAQDRDGRVQHPQSWPCSPSCWEAWSPPSSSPNRHWRDGPAPAPDHRERPVGPPRARKWTSSRTLQGQRAQMMDKAEIHRGPSSERVPRWGRSLGENRPSYAVEHAPRLIDHQEQPRANPVVAPADRAGPGAAPIVKSLTDKIKGTGPGPLPSPRRSRSPKFTLPP